VTFNFANTKGGIVDLGTDSRDAPMGRVHSAIRAYASDAQTS